ncbi:MAG TPA: hypothetical protein VFE46_08170 [Pirellulales bacterium]|jgi:hypothetical protein|nr:hypothetical protein [Pirellulales bacterium]
MKIETAFWFWLFAAVLLVGGCSSTEVIKNPSATLGERKNAQGNIINALFWNKQIQLLPVAQQTLLAFWIDSEREAFRIAPDHRTIVFRSPQGFQKYDVVADAVTDMASNPRTFPTDPLP